MSDNYRSKPAKDPRERIKIARRRSLKFRGKIWHYSDKYPGFGLRRIRGVYKNGSKDE